MGQNVLVTGGAGYIGSHTCKLLSRRGYRPIVLDNLIYGHASFVKWGPFFNGDISDTALLQEIFDQFAPVAVVHFAAYAYVGESMSDPGKYYQNNVCGTVALLETMRRNRCRNFVFSSSCATYGLPIALPITEEHPQAPISPYGRSKLMIEEILKDYDRAYDIRSFCLRYFNASGADQEGELGEDHIPECHALPLAIYAAMGKIAEFNVLGTDYPTADGTAVRDYVHVEDLADAHVRALSFLQQYDKSEAVNLGAGRGYSVLQLVHEVEGVTGLEVRVIFSDRRQGDPPILIADPAKARQLLQWMPARSDLRTIVSSAWSWHAIRHAASPCSL